LQTIIGGKVYDNPPNIPNYFHQVQQPKS
jgi:hypothetical protein